MLFPHPFDSPEGHQGRAPCLVGRHAAADVGLGLHLDVEADLVREIQATRRPTGSRPGKRRSARVRLRMTTRPASAPAVAANPRPWSSGIPAAWKYSGVAVRYSATGRGIPGSSARPSALSSSCTFDRRSGTFHPMPTSVTPGSAASRRCISSSSATD